MTYVAYGSRRSGVAAVELCLAWAGAKFRREDVSLGKGEQLGPAHLKRNPAGKVPALATPDGAMLTESAAILIALDARFPDAGLLPPRGSRALEEAIRWIVFIAGEVYPIVEIEDYPERFGAASATGGIRRRARARLRARLKLLEAAADPAGPWFLGQDFSALDAYLGVVSRWIGGDSAAEAAAWRKAGTPRIERIFGQLSQHNRMGPVIAAHFGP